MPSEGPPLGRSAERRLADGRTRSFPTLADFVDHLRVRGEIEDEEDLLTRRHDLLATIFHAWVQRGQAACQFAVHLAKNREEAGWMELVVPDADDDVSLAAISTLLAGAGSVETVEAVLLLLPSVRTWQGLVGLCGRLCGLPDWHWQEIDGADEGHLLAGLRWTPPGSPYTSWVLAFGPFEELPYTRRAPVTALTLRTRSPANKEGGLDLAKMDSLVDDRQGERFLDLTERNKVDLLAGELVHAARARVTLRVEEGLLPLLGGPEASSQITDSGQPER